MASEALRELLALFTIDVQSDKLKEADGQITDFIGKAKEAGKFIAEAFAVHEVYEFIQGQIEAGTQLERTAVRLGTTIHELQALQLAAQEAGLSADTMSTAMRFLNRNIAEGGAKRAEFAKLGIALSDAAGKARPAGDVMEDLADAMAKMEDPAKRTQIAMSLMGRGGAEMIPLLSKGGDAFREARKDLDELGGGLSEEFVSATKKAEEANVKFSLTFRTLKSEIAMEVLPSLQWLTEKITGFVKAVVEVERKSHVFKDVLDLGTLALAVAGINKLIGAFRSLTFAQVAAAATNPFVWMAAGAVAALLAYNDLKVASEGGKSLFGDMLGPSWVKALKDDIMVAKDAWDVLTAGFNIGGIVLKEVVNSVRAMADLIGEGVAKLWNLQKLAAFFKGDRTKAEDIVNGSGEEIAGVSSGAVDKIAHREAVPINDQRTTADQPLYASNPAAYQPPPGMADWGGGKGGASVTVTNNYDTTVHTAPGADGTAIGNATSSALASSQQRANNNAMQLANKP